MADFGIALAVASAGGARLTQTGLSLGTPQYMSPEQAMGERVVDARSDVYALGAVLYEMLTGEPPFTGSTVAAVVAKVLGTDPAPPTTIRKTIPVHVEAAVLRALAKLPADRWGSAGEFAGAVDARTPSARTLSSSATRRMGTTWRLTALWTVGVALVAFGWYGGTRAARSSRAAVVTRLSVAMPADVVVMTSNTPAVAISQDGSTLAYTTSRGLEIRLLESFESRVVDAPRGATPPFFSPDGRSVGYSTGTAIWKVDVASGRSTRITEGWAYFATWGDDDKIYFNVDIGASGIGVMKSDGTERRMLTHPDSAKGEAYHMSPEYVPGGTLLYSAIGPTGGWGQATLMALDLNSNAPARKVMDGASSARFVAPDHLAYLDATGQVVTRSFDPRTAQVSGDPVVLDSVRSAHWGTAAHVAASRKGTIAYVSGTERGKQVVVERDEVGRLLRRLHTGNQFRPALSPDGRLLAVSDFDGRESHIWLVDMQTFTPERVTFASTLHEGTVWSRDASSIVFARNTLRGGRELVLHSLRARSDSVVLFKAAQLFPEAWSSDGRWLVFSAVEGTRNTLYVADLNGRDSVRVVSGGGLYADLSRDGRWLAYCALEEEGPRTYVVSFPDLARRSQVTTSGACAPRFSADGLRLYYVDRDDWVHRMGVLHVATRASPDATTWTGHRPLFPAYSHTFVVEEDPTRFILVEPDSSRLAREIRVVTGWHDGK